MEGSYQIINPNGNSWLIKSIVSCILFGVGSFLIGMNGLNPYLGKFLVSIGYLISGIFCTIYCKILYVGSTDFKIEAGLAPSILSGIFSHFGNFSLFLGFYYDPENQGIISIIAVGSAVVSSIASYIFYK